MPASEPAAVAVDDAAGPAVDEPAAPAADVQADEAPTEPPEQPADGPLPPAPPPSPSEDVPEPLAPMETPAPLLPGDAPATELPPRAVARGRLGRAMRPRASRAQVLAAALCALLGFALVVQARQTQTQGLDRLQQADLVRLLDNVTNARGPRRAGRPRRAGDPRQAAVGHRQLGGRAAGRPADGSTRSGILAGTVAGVRPRLAARDRRPAAQGRRVDPARHPRGAARRRRRGRCSSATSVSSRRRRSPTTPTASGSTAAADPALPLHGDRRPPDPDPAPADPRRGPRRAASKDAQGKVDEPPS